MTHTRHEQTIRGISLVEVVTAVVIITSASLTLLSTSMRDIRFSYQNRQRLLAQTAAIKGLEHYARFRGYNWLRTQGTTPFTLSIPANAPTLMNTELAELPAATATLYVDNWYATNPFVTYTQADVLRVTVVVSWTPSGGTTQTVRLATLVSDEGFDQSG